MTVVATMVHAYWCTVSTMTLPGRQDLSYTQQHIACGNETSQRQERFPVHWGLAQMMATQTHSVSGLLKRAS